MSGEGGWGDLGFVVGARGWDHDVWVGSFYPDDLPSEWRLGYYANEFPGVLVPEAEWSGTGESGWEEWCDEVPEGFCFYLELSDTSSVRLQQLEACAVSLGDMLKGVLLQGVDAVMEAGSLRVPRLMAVVREDDSACFVAVGQGAGRKGVLLDSEHMPDLRSLRKLLESVEYNGGVDSITPALFVGGKAPDVGKMQEAKTLLELMGLL
ncbi:MAG: ABC transporter permease [Candidatus Sedimenticola sp. (ex Thyasira tokunagai)]